MRERSEKALRLLCIALAAVLLLELVVKLVSPNPLSGLKIPALPTLSAEADSGNGAKASNNLPGQALEVKVGGKQTNSAASAKTNLAGTNLLAKVEPRAPAANSTRAKSSGKDATSTARAEMAMPGPSPSIRPGMGKPTPDLPFTILARVDRVVDSELFGPVFHPMPAGLLGIAGNMAFLRASSGQTGAVKEGDQLGGLKLLRIGINRVLVEEDGQQKELMIFQGLGGQSLLSN